MTPYFFIFTIPILSSLFPKISKNKVFIPGWYLYLFTLFIFIALRENIGGDWVNYKYILDNRLNTFNFLNLEYRSEYLFELILWVIKKLDLNIYFFFGFSSVIFILALSIICLNQPNPWLAIVISFPFLINLLSIGYTRQSIAFSFLIFAIYAIINNKYTSFFFLVFIGTLFHKSLVLFFLLPFFLTSGLTKKIIFFIISSLIILILYLNMKEEFQRLFFIFLGEGLYFESKGAFFRSLFNTLVCFLFLFFSKKFNLERNEKIIWQIFALSSIALFPLVFYYSTLVDRLMYYFYPIQIIFFTRFYMISNFDIKFINTIIVICIYVFLYIFWILNATHFYSWFPYNNLLF